LWDNLESLLGGDCVVDAPIVRLESWGYFNVAQLAFEGGDTFVMLGHALSFCQDTSLALAHVLGVLLRSAVDGGDEAIGCGSDSLVDIVLFKEDVLGGFSRYGLVGGAVGGPRIIEYAGGGPRGDGGYHEEASLSTTLSGKDGGSSLSWAGEGASNGGSGSLLLGDGAHVEAGDLFDRLRDTSDIFQ
jgi:hypothetical protein